MSTAAHTNPLAAARANPWAKYQPLWVGAAALVALPFVMPLLGQTVSTASVLVILAIATLGLNVLVGFTGLVSFGHAAWYGIGAYTAALIQKHWLHEQILIPILLSMICIGLLSFVVGLLILRRRGVYFALMTLALAALSYTVSFRWTEVTGGEDGLGGLQRGTLGPIDLADNNAYYVLVALFGLAVLYLMLRMLRSPFGRVLVAIRENEQRASFQGYNINRYKLAAFVISAVTTGLAGALSGFEHYLVSAEATSVVLSGELLAMVVIGGMHNILGPALGVLFYILFRELFSSWTDDWLLWFGLIFVSFVIFSPEGLVGIWNKLKRHWRPEPKESAAMSRRRIYDGLALPAFLRPQPPQGPVLEVAGVEKRFGGIRAVKAVDLAVRSGQIHALIGPNGAGKTTTFNLISGLYQPDGGTVRLHGRPVSGLPAHEITRKGLARSFQITNLFEGLSIYENLRLSMQAQHPGHFNPWRDSDSFGDVHNQTTELIKFLGLEGIEDIKGGDLSYGGQRLVDLGIALASKPQVLLLDEPLANLDYKLREELRVELPRLFGESGAIFVYATTEPHEALLLGGKTATLSEGRVTQFGTTIDVYSRPADLITAQTFSDPPLNVVPMEKRGNQLSYDGKSITAPAGTQGLADGAYKVAIRPHHLLLRPPPQGEALQVDASVSTTEITGSESFVHVEHGGSRWVALTHGVHRVEIGDRVPVYLDPAGFLVFDADERLVAAPSSYVAPPRNAIGA